MQTSQLQTLSDYSEKGAQSFLPGGDSKPGPPRRMPRLNDLRYGYSLDIPFDDFTNLSGIAEDGDGWRSIDRGGMINKTMKAKQHA